MINFKIFIPIVLLVAAYAVYEFKKGPLKPGESEAVSLETIEINKIIISNEKVIELSKEDNNWKVLRPKEYDGDTNAVNEFLEEIKSFNLEKLEGATELAKYGLDKPVGHFELQDIHGNSEKLSIGSVPALSGKVYLAKNNEVYIGAYDWNRMLNRREDEFRNKSVFDLPENVNRLEIDGESKFTIEKSGDIWISSEIELSTSEVNAFMAKIEYLNAVDFIGETDTIKDPTLTVTIISDEGTDVIKVRDEAEGNYALVYSSQKNILVRVLSEYTKSMMVSRDDLIEKVEPTTTTQAND